MFPSCLPEVCNAIPGHPDIPICEGNTTSGFDLEHTSGLPRPGTWSWDWFTYPVPDFVYEITVNARTAGVFFLGIIVVALSYPIVERLWMRYSNVFRKLTNEQQVVVIQHSIEAFYLTLLFVPVTWAMLALNFQVPESKESAEGISTTTVFYMLWIVNVYMMELAARYRNIRPLIMVHHLCAALDGLLPCFFMSGIIIRCAGVLTYFITFEAPVFVGLLMYRLFPLNPWTPNVIRFGMWVFGLSRPIQMAWIIAIVVSLWDESVAWHGIVQIFFGVFFSSLQMYSLVIHNTLLKKCLKKQREAKSVAKESSDEETAADEGEEHPANNDILLDGESIEC